MRRGPTRHPFVEADPPDVDGLGVHWCGRCFLPQGNAVHDTPETLAEQQDYEARRIGERPDAD